jgi:hypothetical protein
MSRIESSFFRGIVFCQLEKSFVYIRGWVIWIGFTTCIVVSARREELDWADYSLWCWSLYLLISLISVLKVISYGTVSCLVLLSAKNLGQPALGGILALNYISYFIWLSIWHLRTSLVLLEFDLERGKGYWSVKWRLLVDIRDILDVVPTEPFLVVIPWTMLPILLYVF